MKALVYTAPEQLVFQEFDTPSPQPDEAVITVERGISVFVSSQSLVSASEPSSVDEHADLPSLSNMSLTLQGDNEGDDTDLERLSIDWDDSEQQRLEVEVDNSLLSLDSRDDAEIKSE